MHIVGTIRPKPFLPELPFIRRQGLPEHESVAIYQHSNHFNVVYKNATKKKLVAVLTTVHNSFSYVEQMKTEAHMFYNSAKGGVDNFDGMCAETSVSRMTSRWPLCIFYGLINIVMNNAFIIYRSRQNRQPEKYDFPQTVAYHLARPHAIVCYQGGHQYLSK